MIEPLKDNVVIKPTKASETTPGGILLPDRAQKDPKFGIVDSVGPDVAALKPGDTVLLPGWDDGKLEIGGEVYAIFAEKSISIRISA
jgi:co-chaperonin GroES (HSP10)